MFAHVVDFIRVVYIIVGVTHGPTDGHTGFLSQGEPFGTQGSGRARRYLGHRLVRVIDLGRKSLSL